MMLCMSRTWHNARGSVWLSSAMSVLVILGTSAAMVTSNATPSPHQAQAVIGAEVRLGDTSSPASATEVGGAASEPAAAGPELTGVGSGTSPRHGPPPTTTASCGGTFSSLGGNLPQANDHVRISVATSRVRANCAREPRAPGLLRALQRLADHGQAGFPERSDRDHGEGHPVGRANAGAGSSGKDGHPNHRASTTTGHAGGGGKGKGAGR
jgi:hypothetical protein